MKELLENLQGFIQSNIDLAKLEINEKINYIIKKGIKYGGFILLLSFSTLFLLIFLSILISYYSGSYIIGFGLVTLFLILCTIILYFSIIKNNNTNLENN